MKMMGKRKGEAACYPDKIDGTERSSGEIAIRNNFQNMGLW